VGVAAVEELVILHCRIPHRSDGRGDWGPQSVLNP